MVSTFVLVVSVTTNIPYASWISDDWRRSLSHPVRSGDAPEGGTGAQGSLPMHNAVHRSFLLLVQLLGSARKLSLLLGSCCAVVRLANRIPCLL